MPHTYTTEEIRERYERLAHRYDLMEAIPEVLVIRRLRRRLLARARGEVLEVAAGTGRNLACYPPGCRITAVDASPAMLEIARRRAARLRLDVEFHLMDGQALRFPDARFDTVVSTLTTCTYPDPVAALREMARVCRPEGRILLLEHGRSDRPRIARWQDRRADRHARTAGCHWNREPLELVRAAGLLPSLSRRTLLGVLHEIEILPGPPKPRM